LGSNPGAFNKFLKNNFMKRKKGGAVGSSTSGVLLFVNEKVMLRILSTIAVALISARKIIEFIEYLIRN